MAKKTRKQKIIAEYRKRLKLLEQNRTSPETSLQIAITAQNPVEPQPEKNTPPKEIDLTAEELNNKKYFLADFKKSFALISFIITLEIIFYFVTINHNLKLGF